MICGIDPIKPVAQQKDIVNIAKEVQPKAFYVVERLESGHEPIISNITELVGIVVKPTKEPSAW